MEDADDDSQYPLIRDFKESITSDRFHRNELEWRKLKEDLEKENAALCSKLRLIKERADASDGRLL